MRRVAVIGHFGLGLNLANGQTIKTKIVTDELEKYCEEKAFIVDTHGGIKAIFPVILGTIKSLYLCNNIVLMVTENGLKIIVPVISFFNTFFKKRIHYVVVGGWLPFFLKNNHLLLEQLNKFHKVYVETFDMEKELIKLGLSNTCMMPNCKNLDIIENSVPSTNSLRICTFSRVMKEKGIEDAINAVINANLILGKTTYYLDIYGQVDSNQTEWFEKLRKKFPNFINYCGVIKYSQSTEVLKTYFLLLFPTYYEGEGFAGTAIDAFSAGVPVLASDWKYNHEVIKEQINGGLFRTNDVEDLTKRLIEIAKNPNPWIAMREQCVIEAYKYKPCNVLKTLFNEII